VRHKLKLPVSQEAFLSDFWQQSHLFMPAALPDFQPPLSRHEVAGLAFEDEIESRLVEQSPEGWSLFHGPFTEEDYIREHPWTLLVQAVDQVIDSVAQLHTLADFIPRWRIDDVMVSYSNDGASVGPHFDNYDVFLLQGEGQKLWKIGQQCNENTSHLAGSELRILEDFEPSDEYLLNPGDVLYVPPGLAHWGISQGEGTTFSLGFRAPGINHMLSRRVDLALEGLSHDALYADAKRLASTRPGEISDRDISNAVEQVTRVFESALGDEAWFGELVTEPRYEIEVDHAECESMRTLLTDGANTAAMNGDSRLAWQAVATGVLVYANGEHLRVSAEMLPALEVLCEGGTLKARSLSEILQSETGRVLLNFLIDSGCIHVQ
jgi:50S ribosomal protein L16 3-hydroxylase